MSEAEAFIDFVQKYGHGWVLSRNDGSLARCGGPALCKTCQADLSRCESLGIERAPVNTER